MKGVINYQFPKSQTKHWIPLDLTKVFFIILHQIMADYATVETIDKWHLDRGWNGFGYNEYIRKDGSCWIGRGDHIGAQCHGMNSKSYGIGLEGDFTSGNQMTIAQFNTLVERLHYHKKRLPNMVQIEPHNKFVKTECPGEFFPLKQILNHMEENTELISLENKIILLEDEIKEIKEQSETYRKTLKKVRYQYSELYRIYQDKIAELQKLRG